MGWSARAAFSVLSLCVACGSSSDGGGGSTTPTSTTPPPDDPGTVQGTPLDGIFVSAHAAAGGIGTVESPLNKLGDALDLAARSDKPVYACAEKYEEAVVMRDGISMYGYFDCSTAVWTRSTAHATIASPTTPAVLAMSLTKETRFEGFDVSSPDFASTVATATAGTSVALSIRDTTNLSITSCSFKAGNAAPGTSGFDADLNVEASGTNGKVGRAQIMTCSPTYGPVTCANFVVGSAGGTSSCKTPATSGGPGGAGGDGHVDGSGPGGAMADAHGRPTIATAQTAAGGAGRTNVVPVAGLGGNPGTPGEDGMNGSWSFDVDGYHLTAATAGKDGGGGQGGGGGGSQAGYTNNGLTSESPGGSMTAVAATGSGGGAGGCGGLAGTQGTGGGASVALFVVNSGVTMKGSKLETGTGGAAGRGTLGSSALTGGGSPLAPTYAAEGGTGGTGGASGLSGHGAAGPSIALVFKGTRPLTIGVTLSPGAGGVGQPALTKGSKTLPTVVGESKEELQL